MYKGLALKLNKELIHSVILSIILFLCVKQSYNGSSYGLLDVAMVFISIFLTAKVVSSKLNSDFVVYVVLIQVFLGILTITAFKMVDSSWVNIYRSLIYSLILYLYVYNHVTYRYANVIILTCILLSLFNLKVLLDSWGGGFTHHNYELAYYNLNNMGFMSVLMLCCSLYFFSCSNKFKSNSSLNLFLFFISLLLIIISFSRANYLLMFFILFYSAIFIFKPRQSILFLLIFLLFFMLLTTFRIESGFTEGFNFLEKKSTVDSVYNIIYGRFDDVIFNPIESYFKNRHIIEVTLGGNPIPSHSLIVTYMLSFGVFSMLLYIYLNYRMMFIGVKQDPSNKIASLMIFILFLNDASTNASTYVFFIKFLPISIFAISRHSTEKIVYK